MERIDKLMEYLQTTPGDSFLRHALALEYIKIGDDEKARGLFESILENEPGYVGTYYHLAKLLERTGENEHAIKVYERGMEIARAANENLAYNELRAAYEELTF